MSRKKQPGHPRGTPALGQLVESGIEHTVRSYDHDEVTSAAMGYGVEAARALGISSDRVFKTLMVHDGRKHVLGVVPVSRQLDLKAMAAVLGAKQVVLARPDVAERVSGSVVGGISPLGGRTTLDVVLDETAMSYDTILVSAGKRGIDVELSAGDLLRVTGGRTAAIAR